MRNQVLMSKDDNLTKELLLDSESIERKMPQLSRRTISLLKYHKVNPLLFLRTPDLTNNIMLQHVLN